MRLLKSIVIAILVVAVLLNVYTAVFPTRPARAASTQFANILCDQFKPVGAISTNTQVVTAANASSFIYICSYNLNASAALTFSIVEGIGTTCATNTLAMVGGTTAASGPSLGIAGTINYGGGSGVVAKTVVPGDNVCIFPSAGNLSGVVGFTQSMTNNPF